MRLQKYLSQAGICSRRKGEEFISKGMVRVNGQVITQLGTQIEPSKDRIELLSETVEDKAEAIYIVLNKPKGYVTSCKHKNEKLVLDLVDIPQRIYPIGRLDKDSCGLILLTNDGELHNRICHPSFDHEKEYEVIVLNAISDQNLDKMRKGMSILGQMTRPSKITRMSDNSFRISLKEGKNRQIRRMVEQTNNRVISLKRIRIQNIKLGNLREGLWRYLTQQEIIGLKAGI